MPTMAGCYVVQRRVHIVERKGREAAENLRVK
jgi:hypothetical protein